MSSQNSSNKELRRSCISSSPRSSSPSFTTILIALAVICFTSVESFTATTVRQPQQQHAQFPTGEAFGSSSPSSSRYSPRTISFMSTLASSAPSPSPFEKRMRKMVLGRERKEVKRRGSNVPDNLKVVRTLQEYKDVVGDESERIVAVRFFAPWCKACKAVAPLYYRLVNQFPNVIFVEVPVTEKNANLHQGLGVKALPFGHIYHPDGGLVEEQSMSRKNFRSFEHKLRSYIAGSCDLEDSDVTSPYPEHVDDVHSSPEEAPTV